MHSMQPLFIIPHGKQYNAQPMVNGISLTIVQSFTVTCGNAEAIILSESMFLWLFDALPFYNTCLWIPYIVSVLAVSVTRFYLRVATPPQSWAAFGRHMQIPVFLTLSLRSAATPCEMDGIDCLQETCRRIQVHLIAAIKLTLWI